MKIGYITSEESGLPFSEAIEAKGFLFISGQVHSDASGNLITGDMETKTHQTMRNVQTILEKAGLTFSDVVKMEIFLPDLSERAVVSKVYESYLSHPFPVRVMIGVSELPMGADIEITAIAVRQK
jgi:2-iminobutanoate/2-iminopropanoate deaminase